MHSSSPIAPISSLPSTPYSRSRISMQRACDALVRLQSYHDKLIGSPPVPDAPKPPATPTQYSGELGSLEEMALTLDTFVADAQRLLFRLEEALGTA